MFYGRGSPLSCSMVIPEGLQYIRAPLPPRKPFTAQGLNTQPKLQPSFNKTTLDSAFSGRFFFVRLTIWNCLPGAWLHTSEWRSDQKNHVPNEKFFSLDWFIFYHTFCSLKASAMHPKKKKILIAPVVNGNYLINRVPNRYSYSSLKS